MKAFLVSLVLLVAISVSAALVLQRFEMRAGSIFATDNTNLRL